MPGLRYQPQGAARLDRRHLLARGLVHLWGLNLDGSRAVRDVVGIAHGRFGVGFGPLNTGNSWRLSPSGFYINFDDSDTGTVDSVALSVGGPNGSGSPGTSDYFTVAARILITAYSTGTSGGLNGTLSIYGGETEGIQFRLETDGRLQLLKQGIAALGSSYQSIPLNKPTDVAMTWANGLLSFYINGALSGVVNSSPQSFKHAQYYLGYAIFQNGNRERLSNGSRIYRCDVWNRALSADEVRAWSLNPWQVFADPAEDEAYIAARSSWPPLVVTPAALALNGGNVGLSVSRRVGVQPAAMQVEGRSVTMRASRRVGVQGASLAVAGAEAAVRVARRLTVQPGDLATAGGAVAVKASRKIAVSSAAVQITGGVVALRAIRRLAFSATSLLLEGGQTQLRVARRLSTAPMVMAVTGGQILFEYAPAPGGGSYVIQVSPAALALAGGDIGMRVTRRVSVTPAALALVAGSVRILAACRMMVGAASLGASGGQVLLRAFRRLPVEPSHLVATGGAVVLRYSSQVEYARAPAGVGYSPQRVEVMARPIQSGGSRPPAVQRNRR